MLITYTQNPNDTVGVFPASGSNPVMMSCSEIMAQAPSGYNAFMVGKCSYGNGYAGHILFFNITGDTIYLADLEYLLGRTDNSKNCAGVGEGNNITVSNNMYRVQSENTRTLQNISSTSWSLQTKDNIQYRYNILNENWTIGNIVYFPSSVTNIYENGNPLVTYQWSSVPSISGNGKTYRLTDILNINDGNPMNDVQYDGNLDFSAKSKVNNLIDSVLQDDSKVTVNYTIPEGNYEYIKLVYKKNRIPDNKTDGTAITLTQGDTSVEISGIADGNIYWFVIFTDVSESEPVKFDTIKHYLVNISAKTGKIDLAGHGILTEPASLISCNDEYFYITEEVQNGAGFYVILNQNFTGNLDLWFETECYIGDADFPNDKNSNSEYHFTLHGSDLSAMYESRIWQITYRNAMFTHPVSGWLDYDYWYNNKIRNVASVMDDTSYANKWTRVSAKTEIRDGKITKLITYRDGEVFREDSESSYDISNITFPYLSFDFPTPDTQHPIYNIYRAKYFRAWTEEVTT